MMLYTTFALAHKSRACADSYKKMARHLGGVRQYGHDTPISLTKVLEVNGLQNAIWAMRCTTTSAEDLLIEFACRCAEHTLHFYEDKYPEDKRPRQAIEAARVCITDKSAAARAAGAAAWDAAWAAAWAAAGDAAWAAWAAWAAGAAARDAAWAAAGAAGAAAWAAAGAAVWDAARAAARAAAWAAEEQWQKVTLLTLLQSHE